MELIKRIEDIKIAYHVSIYTQALLSDHAWAIINNSHIRKNFCNYYHFIANKLQTNNKFLALHQRDFLLSCCCCCVCERERKKIARERNKQNRRVLEQRERKTGYHGRCAINHNYFSHSPHVQFLHN
jgi:hypothetical protein